MASGLILNNANALTGAVSFNTTGSSGYALVDTHRASPTAVRSTVGGNLYATTDANSGAINLNQLAVGSSYGTIYLTTNGSGHAIGGE